MIEVSSWKNRRKLLQQSQGNRVVWWVKTSKILSHALSKFEIFFGLLHYRKPIDFMKKHLFTEKRFVYRNKTSLPFEDLLKKDGTVNIQQGISIMWLVHIFRKFIFYWHYPKTFRYWVNMQWGQSYLVGRRCLFSLGRQTLLVMVSQYHNGIN